MSHADPQARIGISLSGGGFRATVFHLGVLGRLAYANRLDQVDIISTVSGGTLCAGLVHTLSSQKYTWPSSPDFLATVLPGAFHNMTTKNLAADVVIHQILEPWTIFGSRANNLSAILKSEWGIGGKLKDLSPSPRWMINATCYETGKDWRFEQFRMGDYVYGYTYQVGEVTISDAMAASAGFPLLIGPLELDTSRYPDWFKYDDGHNPHVANGDLQTPAQQTQHPTHPIVPASPVHLWDGGAYDNYGLEGLSNPDDGWSHGLNFLIVSDAAGKVGTKQYEWGVPALERLVLDIMLDQIRSMRARSIVERMINHRDPGAFIKLGNTCRDVLENARGKPGALAITDAIIQQWEADCLGSDAAQSAQAVQTEISQLPPATFELLFRHGFEVADYTLSAYYPNDYQHKPYLAFRQEHRLWG